MKLSIKMKIVAPVVALCLCGLGAGACNASPEATPGPSAEAPKAEAPKAEEPKAEGIPTAFDAPPAVGVKARCPVMGGEFTVSEGSERSEYKGKHFAFCCPGCKPSFDENPEKYLKK